MAPSTDFESRVARCLAHRGGSASGAEIARELLRALPRTPAAGDLIARLVGPSPRLVAREAGSDIWILVEAPVTTAAMPAAGPAAARAGFSEPLAAAAVAHRRGAPFPVAVALRPLSPDGRLLEWPGGTARSVRAAARRFVLLVAGGARERDALVRWMGRASFERRAAGEAVFSMDALLRRASLKVPRPAEGSLSPSERCLEAAGRAREILDRWVAEGIADAPAAAAWLSEREEFDFTGREFGRFEIELLPESPGVYRFFDASGSLVYVGQSKNLRSRIGSYFRPRASKRQAAIAARAHRLEAVVERSDLGALVREASEIRRRRPAANRQVGVRERPAPYAGAARPALSGARVFVLPAAAGAGSRDVFFVREGRVVDRRRMSAPGRTRAFEPGWRLHHRAEALIARIYFGRGAQAALPGLRARRLTAAARPGISARSAAEATQLLSTWLRRRGGRAPSFDPTDCADPQEAARRLAVLLGSDPDRD